MAAEQFGVNTLARAMAIILPVNTIGQTWFPYLVSWLREYFGNYHVAMSVVFGVAMLGALSIALLPRRAKVGRQPRLEWQRWQGKPLRDRHGSVTFDLSGLISYFDSSLISEP